MSKLEFLVASALGFISMILGLLKKQPQTPKVRKWIVGLKAASAALSEMIDPSENDVSESPANFG